MQPDELKLVARSYMDCYDSLVPSFQVAVVHYLYGFFDPTIQSEDNYPHAEYFWHAMGSALESFRKEKE